MMRKLMPAYWAEWTRIEKFQEHFAATTMSVHAAKGQELSKRFPFNLSEQLKKVTAPALIVAGDKDAFCPPTAATEIHLNLPNSKLLIFEDCGHFM